MNNQTNKVLLTRIPNDNFLGDTTILTTNSTIGSPNVDPRDFFAGFVAGIIFIIIIIFIIVGGYYLGKLSR